MYNTQNTVNSIKAMAKSKNISIGEMLSECGLSKNALSSMQSRGSWLQANNLAKIADYLDCSVDYLLGRTDNPEVNKTIQHEKIYKLSLAEQGEIAAEGGSLTSNTVNKKIETTL